MDSGAAEGGETPVSEGEPAEAAPAEAAPAAAPADPRIDAVATALAVQPDRAARLLEALDIIGDDLDDLRLGRVFQGEKGRQHAVSRGEFHYVIDRVSAPKRRDDRRGGGRGRGGERGERGGFGGRGDRDKPRGLGSLKAGASK